MTPLIQYQSLARNATATFICLIYFFSSTDTEWNIQDCGISKAVKDISILPSKIKECGTITGFTRACCLHSLRRQHFSVFGCQNNRLELKLNLRVGKKGDLSDIE